VKGSAAAVARLDATQVEPFRIVRDSQGTLEGTDPKLPAGWLCEVWNKDAEGEFRSEPLGGRRALRVSATKGSNAAQFVFRPSNAPDNKVTLDRSYQVRIEYQSDPGIEGYVHVQARDNYSMLVRIPLRSSGAGWHTAVGTIRPGGKDFQLAIGSTRTAPGKFLSIAQVELIPDGAAAAPAAPAALPVERPVFSLDLSKVAPFSFTYQDGQPGDPDWRNKVPSGVYLHCWKKESVAQFRAEVIDGRPALGVTNLNDTVSSQMLFQFDDGLTAAVRPGGEYRVRLEYRTTNDAEGRVHVRNPTGGEFPSIAEARLGGTDGKWRWAETTFRRPADGKIDLCVVNATIGEGNTLSVRGLEVLEITPGSSGNASPTGEPPLFRYSAADAKLGRVELKRKRTSQVAPEMVPPPYFVTAWKDGIVAEAEVLDVDGARAIAMRNLPESTAYAVQIASETSQLTLLPDTKYVVRISYRTDGNAKAWAEARYANSGKAGIRREQLQSTNGGWAVATIEFTSTPEQQLFVVICNENRDADRVYVRTIEVFQAK
jgi:hypothetical protein